MIKQDKFASFSQLQITASDETIQIKIFKPEIIRETKDYLCRYVIQSSTNSFPTMFRVSTGKDYFKSLVNTYNSIQTEIQDLNLKKYDGRIGKFDSRESFPVQESAAKASLI